LKNQYKILGILLICFLFGSILGYTLAQSGNTFIISEGIYPHSVSYTIWEHDSIYYAKNPYGVIDYQGTNASQVIDNAIDNLGNGTIFFKSGIYQITHNITVESNQHLIMRGEGKYSTILNGSGLSEMLIIGDSSAYISEFTIEDMQLRGTIGITELLTIRNAIFPCIKNVLFLYYSRGLILETYGGAEALYFAEIQNCDFEGGNTTTALSGIFLHGTNSSWRVTTAHIIGGRYKTNNVGLYMEHASDIMIFMGDFENNGVGIGLASSVRISVYASNFEANSSYDLDIDSNSDANIFRDCNFAGTLSISGSDNKFYNNIGFYTQNYGNSTGTGSEQTIAHGLSGIPILVLLSPTTTNAYESTVATGSNIYITADNTEDYYWYVEYQP